MVHYFKKTTLKLIASIVIILLPIQGNAQTADSITVQEVQPLPKQGIKFKGWYFGGDIGVVNTRFNYRIPKDPITKLYAINSTLFGFGSDHLTVDVGASVFAEFKARYVVGRVLTIDFINLVKYDQVPITLYETDPNGGWFSLGIPKEKYSLNIATNQTLIMPHLKTGNPNHYFFVGLGVGLTSVLYRGGNFSRKYDLLRFSPMYRADIGFAVRVKENYINFTISANSITRLADYGWSAYMNYTTYTLGYVLPISIFKKKSKAESL